MDWPVNRWNYHTRIEVTGSDRHNLPDCLEAEELASFAFLSRDEMYAAIREGELVIAATSPEPFPAFAHDLATISAYLFQIVRGVEVSERHVGPEEVDDVRAWKVIARQGEWVRVPLVPRLDEEGDFHVHLDADDLEVIEARWDSYPRWFHDGMRRKYPHLRAL